MEREDNVMSKIGSGEPFAPMTTMDFSQIKQCARASLAEHYRRDDERETEAFMARNGQLQQYLEGRAKVLQHVEEAIEQRNWERALWLLPRPYRLDFFGCVLGELSDAEYARLLADAWIDAERPSRNLDSWIALFTAPRLQRELLMTPDELAHYRALSDPVRIWRGAGRPRYARGISWTTDADQAAWFAQRFASRTHLQRHCSPRGNHRLFC